MFDNLSVPTILMSFVAMLFSLSVHEASHATVAYLLDDDTALHMGRITLNPIAHIDVIGTILFPLLGLLAGNSLIIGWAKPVTCNQALLTRKFKIKTSTAMIALAGPLANFMLSIIFLIISVVTIKLITPISASRSALISAAICDGPEALMSMGLSTEILLLLGLSSATVRLNVLFAAFNMIPVGPLDGAGVLGYFIPDRWQYSYNSFRYNPLGLIGLMLLMCFNLLSPIIYLIMMPIDAILALVVNLLLSF